MKTVTTFGIDSIIRLKKKEKAKALLYARVTANGNRTEISLKEEIHVKDWDPGREMVKGKSSESKAINNYIEVVRFRLKEKYRLLEDKHCLITCQAIKDAYLGSYSVQKSEHTLCELIQYHAKIAVDKLEPGTLKNYGATERYIKGFIKAQYKADDIYLVQLNYAFITELEQFIRNYQIKEHDPCKGNGVMKHLERLKKMVKWAKQLGWIQSNPFADYKLDLKDIKGESLISMSC